MGELFEIKGNPQLDKNNFTFSASAKYPYFTRTIFNNGVAGRVEYLDEEHKINGGCLAVGMMGMQFFYMDKDFYAGQFTKRAIPKSFTLTPRTAIYFISLLNRHKEIFKNVLVRNFKNEFNKANIQLPIKDGAPNFDFMERFVAELEAQHAAELEAYLKAAELKDYRLTTKEQQAIGALKDVNWKDFKLDDLFIFKSIKQAKSQKLIPTDNTKNGIPYIIQSTSSNMFARNVNKKWLINNNEPPISGNHIVLGVTLPAVSYQPKEFGASQVITATSDWLNHRNGVFIATAISKLMYQFSYNRKPGLQIYKDMEIQLPVKDKKPDYEFMETFISAIRKLVITDVVKYADLKIAATKHVIEGTK